MIYSLANYYLLRWRFFFSSFLFILLMRKNGFHVISRDTANIEPNCQFWTKPIRVRETKQIDYTITNPVMCIVHVTFVSTISERWFEWRERGKIKIENLLKGKEKKKTKPWRYSLRCERPPCVDVCCFFPSSALTAVSCLAAISFLHVFVSLSSRG